MRKLSRIIPNLIFIATFFSTLLIALIWYQIRNELRSDKQKSIATAIQRNNNLVISLEQYAITTIRNGDALLQMAKMDYKEHRHLVHVNAILESSAIDKEAIDCLAIINEAGNMITSNMQLPDSNLNFADRDYFNFHRNKNNSVYISKPVFSRTIRKTVIVISRRIDNPDGSFGGVVAVQFEPSTFTRFYTNAKLRPHDIISLIAPDGTTYARRTGNKESFGENISKSPLFIHLKTRQAADYFAKDAIRGVPTYFSYRQLEDYPIIATVGTAEVDVLADHRSRARREYVFGSVLSLLILVFLYLVVKNSRYRIRNLKRIKDAEIRYRSIFENSQDAIITALSNGEIEAMNPAAGQMFGFEKSSDSMIRLEDLFKDTEPPVRITHPPSGEEAYVKNEVLFTRADGSVFTGELVYSKYTDEIGNERFVVLIRDISLRKQMEKRLLEEQKNYERKLTTQIIRAQEREREFIGHELHDNVNQILTTVKLNLEMAITHPDKRPALLPQSIQYLMMSINEIRKLSRELSAPTLGNQSLIESITDLIGMVESSTNLKIEFSHDQYRQTISKDQQLAIFRILQEQFNNIIKHSGADKVKVSLLQRDDVTELTIRDNGKGFQTSHRSHGIGLNNILSRAQIHGGKMDIHSEPGNGMVLKITLPLESHDSGLTNTERS
jgi:PAS domain S-box-containing protein